MTDNQQEAERALRDIGARYAQAKADGKWMDTASVAADMAYAQVCAILALVDQVAALRADLQKPPPAVGRGVPLVA